MYSASRIRWQTLDLHLDQQVHIFSNHQQITISPNNSFFKNNNPEHPSNKPLPFFLPRRTSYPQNTFRNCLNKFLWTIFSTDPENNFNLQTILKHLQNEFYKALTLRVLNSNQVVLLAQSILFKLLLSYTNDHSTTFNLHINFLQNLQL